ncbi:MAG: single-stranded-DNA-specific exonuclease RecJ [Bradymonadales bacterium]
MSKNDPKHWNLHPIDYAAVQNLASDLRLNPLLSTVLVNRGAKTAWQAQYFLEPKLEAIGDSYSLLNMQEAVERCMQALVANESILIFGDNDVDGVTSTTLCYQYLGFLKAKLRYFLPRRKEDGHGFNDMTITAAMGDDVPDLFIVVDGGMTGNEEIERLKSRGIDTIILDHHTPSQELPDAIIVNPKVAGNPPEFNDLAAVGVVFHFVRALDALCRKTGFYEKNDIEAPVLGDFLDLVCLGTIADVVPLVGQNRIFVSLGLDVIRRRRRSGIAALLSDLSVEDSAITERTICFRLAPRINAAGRMGDPNECVALLSAYRYTTAKEIAKTLEDYNTQRRNAEASIINEAMAEAQEQVTAGKRLIVIAKEKWPQGILGIISSRLVDKFYRPALVIAIVEDKCRGSARSIDGFSILQCFQHCADLLEDFGGHHAAAGVNLRSENLEEFIQRAQAYTSANIKDDASLTRRLDIDAEITVAELLGSWKNQYLQLLAPFGTSNKEPSFLLKRVKVIQLRRMNRSYMRMRVKQGNHTLNLSVPINIASSIVLSSTIHIVVSPKYAPNKEKPEFILLALHDEDAS